MGVINFPNKQDERMQDLADQINAIMRQIIELLETRQEAPAAILRLFFLQQMKLCRALELDEQELFQTVLRYKEKQEDGSEETPPSFN